MGAAAAFCMPAFFVRRVCLERGQAAKQTALLTQQPVLRSSLDDGPCPRGASACPALPAFACLQVVKEGFDPNVGLFKATTDNKLYPNPHAQVSGWLAGWHKKELGVQQAYRGCMLAPAARVAAVRLMPGRWLPCDNCACSWWWATRCG